MESIKQVTHIITPNCFLASLDIKDAFYTIPINHNHCRYLKFLWGNQCYQFNVMPNGYIDAMRVFTKVLKPIFSRLRKLGHPSIIYVDDSLLKGDNYAECLENIELTKELLESTGFTIHYNKSVISPTQNITFLGFDIDTVRMTISITDKKKAKIQDLCISILKTHSPTTRRIACLLGNISASFEGVPFGRLHFRDLEQDKIKSLKQNKGNFESTCKLSDRGIKNIKWWRDNISTAVKSLTPPKEVDYVIYTDASNEGWGANDQYTTINGRWNSVEKQWHINVLEMVAIKYALMAFIKINCATEHIRIMSDNATAIAYINKQGGSKNMHCNSISVDIWETCISHNIFISAAHIPGVQNTVADVASRQFHDAAEWMLDPKNFNKLCSIYGRPDIDMFATRLNKQLETYVSWAPDPGSISIDALATKWNKSYIYIFPPFSMYWPIIKKIQQEAQKALVIAPVWPTQTWFPVLLQLMIKSPVIINSKYLMLPGTNRQHPLSPKMRLMAVLCSNSVKHQQEFLQTQQRYYLRHGDGVPPQNTSQLSRDSQSFVVKNRLIHVKLIHL